jgi:hypothetical protein
MSSAAQRENELKTKSIINENKQKFQEIIVDLRGKNWKNDST